MANLKQWRFWCDGCHAVAWDTFDDRDREREAGVRWLAAHHGHGYGGFVTPEPFRYPCDRCGVGLDASQHLCLPCRKADAIEDAERYGQVDQ